MDDKPQGNELWPNVIAHGTLTTSSATVPADNSRTEGNDFFKGCILMTLTGAVAFQPRPIRQFTAGTGVFTLDEPFTAAPGLVAYVILASDYPVQRLIDIFSATDPKVVGRTQIFEKSITSAANAGDVTVATITDQPCQIESVIIHADAAQTADMTSCGIFGGAGKVITFISAADAVRANLDSPDKQVAWTGAVRLVATKTIVISLVGTGATAVDLTIIIKYRACASGGYLA